MAGTAAGAAKRQRCTCGAWKHTGPCSKPGPKATKTAEEKRATQAAYQRKWRAEHPDQSRGLHARWRRNVKLRVLQHYSRSDQPFCACCQVGELVFLTLDHMSENGAAARRASGTRGGTAYYAKLLRSGLPEDYQVLCWNCNAAKHLLGVCPHQSAADGVDAL